MKKHDRALKLSVNMAIGMGMFLPLDETVRRSNQLLDSSKFLAWFDDYILGFILLISAYLAKRKSIHATSYLIAAWGFVSGALFLSLLIQIDHYMDAIADPGIFSSLIVLIAKIVILSYMLLGLSYAIKANDSVFP